MPLNSIDRIGHCRPMLLCAIFAAQNALAQATPKPQELTKVEVRDSSVRQYTSRVATSGTRLAIPLKETPLTIQVIDQALIRDKGITTPRELADVVAGVQQVVGYGNTASQWFVIRGFSSDGVNYRDGFRSADKYTPRDFANVERVEFVKGPASVLYGQSQPAGAVNTITKSPLAYNMTAADVRGGSFGTLRSTIDVNRALGAFAFRVNAAADRADSFSDFERSRNYLLAPSLRFTPTDRIGLLYAGEFQRTELDGFGNGLPMAPGVFDLRAGATTGQPWARLRNSNASHRFEATFRVNDRWSLRQGIYDGSTRRSYAGVSPAFNQFDGTPVADYPVQYNGGPKDDQRNTVFQSEVYGTLATGGVTHTLLGGFEAFRSAFTFAFYDQFGCDTAGNCFGGYMSRFATGLPAPSGGFTGGALDSSAARTRAVYLHDQIAWRQWRVMLGVRHDRAETTAGTETESRSATTGRIGVLFLFSPRTSVYGSVGQSFIPNVGARSGGGVLKPEMGVQGEVGVMHQWGKGLESSLALFDITKSNIRYRATSSPSTYLTFGEQQSRGVEASVSGQVTSRFRIVANVAHLAYAKTTKDRDSTNVGKALFGVARNTGNLWGLHDLPLQIPGMLSIGAGVVVVSARTADAAASGFLLPAYTRIDAGAFYRVRQFDVALNLKNLSDARVFDTAEGYFVQRQAPRNLTLTAGVRF